MPRGSVTQSVREFILAKLEEERKTGVTHMDLKSGDIHRQMNFKNRLPIVCSAMNTVDGYRTQVIHETPSKLSSTNVVRYFLDLLFYVDGHVRMKLLLGLIFPHGAQ